MSIKDITIVITSFKSDEIIRNCLNSIDRQYRIILVENSNNLELKKSIEREFTNVECILTGENFGYGKANNIGLKKVKTKYALILNPDATLHASALENFFKTVDQISEFAIIGPYIQVKKDENKITDGKNSNPILVKNVKGFAMFLNMQEFQDVCFFDENFFFYFEEIEESITLQCQTIHNRIIDIKSETTGNIVNKNYKRGKIVNSNEFLVEISMEDRQELLNSYIKELERNKKEILINEQKRDNLILKTKEQIKLYEIEYQSAQQLIDKGLSSKSKLSLASFNLANARSNLMDIELTINLKLQI